MTFRSFAIIPAAGRSRRMGEPKLLLPWDHTTVIEVVLAAWAAGGVTRRIAVVHRDDTKLAELIRRQGVEVVTPDPPPLEMKDSVQAALQQIAAAHAPSQADVWLLAPADLPRLSSAAIRLLLAAHRPEDPAILVPVANDGRRSHPALFPWSLSRLVGTLSATAGVDSLMDQHPFREIICPAMPLDDDLDTPDDYRQQRDSAWSTR